MAETKSPKVFISYAWENDLKTWVLEFATRLRSDGVNAILDQWETVPGDELPEFMEKSVRESDFVVFICTPTYKRKSDRRKGGVGYEGHIITGEIFQKNNHRKFIPVLRKGKWATASPSWAISKLFIDFRGEPYSEASYQQLLNTLLGKSPAVPPLRGDTLRKIADREAAERAAREKTEKEAAEKTQLEAEELVKQKAAKEKTDSEAAEKISQEKAEQELKREVGKLLKNERWLERKYKWDMFFLNIRHKLSLFFINVLFYFLPILFGLIVIAGLSYVFFYMPKNIPVQVPTPTFSPTFTPYVVPTLISTFTSTDTLPLNSTSTESSTPIPPPLPTEITDAKGVTMRLVPAGKFTMGSDADDALAECQKYRSDCQRDWFTDEEPPHEVYLGVFYMDKYEVTNALYKACVDVGVCAPPYNASSSTRSSYYGNSQYDDYPVIYVNWNMAKTYCEWRGARLPTEAQWEKAARSTDGRTYPWGEGIDCDKANYNFRCVGDTTKVGSYESGKSPYGIYDLAGNVWEWVNDWYDENYYQSSPASNPLGPESGTYRALRGGSWYVSDSYVRASYRTWFDPTLTFDRIGFRCARSP